ncbi:hypothetical protein K1719_026627 [Acacia pycnantha]|nr:hypothetical protein K1719_026627 [Acacia pycnantha]
MATMVKGLFRGLKNNITNIFEEREENIGIQIGFPTDVKHVAHIGLDGSSANTPTWMTTLKSSAPEAPELLAAAAPAVNSTVRPDNKNNTRGEAIRSIKEIPRSKPAKETFFNSPTQRGSDEHEQIRRHRHTNTEPSSDSSSRGSTRHARRHRSTNQAGELTSEDTTGVVKAAAPKHHRRRKSKTANGDGSGRSSRKSSKGNSLSEISFTDMESGDATKHCESLA